MAEAQLHADLVEPAELFRLHIAVEFDVGVRRAQVLAQRQDVDVDRAQVFHDFHDFFVRLAESENDARLGGDIGRDPLGDAEDLEETRVPTAWTCLLVEARDGFGVVVVDVRACFEHGSDGVLVALEIGHEHFHGASGQALADLPDGFGKDVRTKIGQVVAVDGRDDRVAKIEFTDRLRDAGRFLDIVRRGRPCETAQ